MRRFSSYGPLDKNLHYYAPRKELIEKGFSSLLGDDPEANGHYFTVWAPRQTGKSWLMREILFKLKKDLRFDTIKINLEYLKEMSDKPEVLKAIAQEIGEKLGKSFINTDDNLKFQDIFKKGILDKPLILILDEFDSLEEKVLNSIVSEFRNIYLNRMDEVDKTTKKKSYLLHSVALIGVRSVLGIENIKGSPFNVQRSLRIPNLTFAEVQGMFHWYEKESGQSIEPEVIEKLYKEMNGQPGLTCWLGELLTEGFEGYTNDRNKPITMREFEIVYAAATYALPNNNILNLISKAKQEPNKTLILKMFRTDVKLEFKFDDSTMNALYMNGLVEPEIEDRTKYYLKFASPFIQKRIFNYFSGEYFSEVGKLYDPFVSMNNIITDTTLNIPAMMNLYQTYIKKNHDWLFKSVPRRSDMRIYEAMFHFNLYSYLSEFLRPQGGRVFPEFPTGNGKIDLILTYTGKQYGLELKSFSNERNYNEALKQASRYGKELHLKEIYLVVFVEYIDEDIRKEYEVPYPGEKTGVKVIPIFIETGN